MSKAFTRESDDLPDRPTLPPLPSLLPPGVKNYLTPDGALRLQEELKKLIEIERPQVVATDDSNDRRQLSGLDQRIQHLQQCLRSAEVVPPPATPCDQVRFGATITVRDRSGSESRYRIVGVDETDIERGWVSWLSPIAKALLNAKPGQGVRFKFPSGEEQLEIVGISYQ